MSRYILGLMMLSGLLACSDSSDQKSSEQPFTDNSTTLFSKVEPSDSGINFTNVIKQTVDFNFMNYMYVYTGAGVAVGDVDKDGLDDIYFVSNLGPNRLYKNKGDLQFEDITNQARVQDFSGFSTGVTMLDVNQDGWLDIYVSKAGSLKDNDGRRNLLFVNQQDGTFSEEAARWGIDDPGYTTQAYPIDYDRDGDLDLYILNHRYDFQNNGTISGEIQSKIEELTSDHLYRNDGDRFTKVTAEAGLYNKAWGLSAVVSDFNDDGWDDIYLANDFLEPDAMMINQGDGTFKNEILTRINHISTNSMGSDYADLNNDLYPDLMTVDMVSENYARSKENMASMSTSNFENMVKIGYHHAYMANMLHYNYGNGKFQETGQMSGVTKSDWSWAPLLADFDNDGYKDIFITNGVDRDYTNQDVRKQLYGIMERGESMQLDDLLNMIPTEELNNYIYKNKGDLSFEKTIVDWGMEDPGYSNGAAYADFDNDGDLDLVTNNLYEPAGVYENHANKHYLQVALSGSSSNPLAIGSKVRITLADGSQQYQELYLTRGFESSVSPALHFGLGDASEISEVLVIWPDGKSTSVTNTIADQRMEIDYSQATNSGVSLRTVPSKKNTLNAEELGLDYVQNENDFNDYALQLLIPQKQSTKGSGLAKADVNGDGLTDVFVGNALGASAALYIQKEDGKFRATNKSLWSRESVYEDSRAHFFDADGDGDQDLYVASTGYELAIDDPLLQDRLYLNDGEGNFSKQSNALPAMLTATKAIASADYDGDGDLDLFVGGNVIPGQYPLPPRSYLLQNDNGKFTDVTSTNQALEAIGMTSEAIFTDYDGDSDTDLLVVGEWMQPTFYENINGSFDLAANISGLEDTGGWWFSVISEDFDGDGDADYVIGNVGKNNKFQPKNDKPIYIYSKDFDDNGSYDVALSKINDGRLVPVRGKECSSEQNPFLLDKIKTYKEFASLEMKDIYGEDKLKDAYRLQANTFETLYLENQGEGQFKIHHLPVQVQVGPTLSMVSGDYNNDGHLDILGVGAIYDAEVETIRYDSNYGYVLLGDGSGGFTYSKSHDPFIDSDAKEVIQLELAGRPHFMVLSNKAPLEVFSLEP
ncbi:VCBS repeat-containing protein [Aureitalea marina]|uniref:ASPIC/UnbV domain-containing protein n=1 Tax=Aureitalea marina TaxID=930804 RepID=A0A2S7KQG9_9FLAO|nr:VCBS repeat-containing protein [Aureitalea marina]PQB04872.1 hypothetical protein BST85_08195 [Aureitalea marina]